jgi:hypothetical protein
MHPGSVGSKGAVLYRQTSKTNVRKNTCAFDDKPVFIACLTNPMARSTSGTGISVPRSSTVPGNRQSKTSVVYLAIAPVLFVHLCLEQCKNCHRAARGEAPGDPSG